MKTRVNKEWWVRLPFIVGARRLAWVQRRYNMPVRPLSMPKLEGGRNKQWQKALEMQYRSFAKGTIESLQEQILRMVGHEQG